MKPLMVRLPDELHKQVEQAASANHRSLNSEVITMLEECVVFRQQGSVVRGQDGHMVVLMHTEFSKLGRNKR